MAVAKTPTSFLEALVAARAEMPVLVFDATNPHFRNRYLSLSGVMEGVAPILAKHGIVVTHAGYRNEDGAPWLRTSLIHTSGDRLDSDLPIAGGNNPQQMGSAITYARRYAVLGLLGMVGDEDDDGNAASAPAGQPAVAKGPSDPQMKLIKTLLGQTRNAKSKDAADAAVKDIMDKTLDELTAKDAPILIDKLKEEKAARGGAF